VPFEPYEQAYMKEMVHKETILKPVLHYTMKPKPTPILFTLKQNEIHPDSNA
jgi:hypothetical protein